MTNQMTEQTRSKAVGNPKAQTQSLRSFDSMVEGFSFATKYFYDVERQCIRIDGALDQAKRRRDFWQLESALRDAKECVNAVEVSGALSNINSLRRALSEFSPDDDPDVDDGMNPTRRYIAKQVAVLLGSIPNGAPADPEVYTAMLIEEVLALEVCKHAIESGMRRVRRTTKFLPAISEVLEILKEENKLWHRRFDIHSFDDRLENLREAIADAESAIENEAQRKKKAIEDEKERRRLAEEAGDFSHTYTDFG